MAPATAAAAEEAAWRGAEEASQYTGEVELERDAGGEERLVIRCEEVAAEHGADAFIADDGRTVGVGVGDTVAFGIVLAPGGRGGAAPTPVAVNVWRAPKKKKKHALSAEEQAMWADWQGAGFDYSQKKEKKGKADEDWDEWGEWSHVPKELRGEQMGVVRGQSYNSGNMFISHRGCWDRHERDVTLRYELIPADLSVGDAVLFEVDPPRSMDFPPYAR